MSGIATFTFDAETHEYRTAGRKVPACTRVLDHGGLVKFDFINADALERKSELGREVHKACHLWNDKKAFTCDDAVRGYLASWQETVARMHLHVTLCEHQQIAELHGMTYGMQIDAAAQVPAGMQGFYETIIELKIGDVRPHHGIQLAGYAAGLYHATLQTPMGRFRSRKRIVVRLNDNGTLARVHRFEAKSDFDVFAAALFTTYWKMQHDKFYREITP